MTDTLIVFAREPLLGKVKTRLASQVGAPAALAIYSRLLDRTLRTACQFVRRQNRLAGRPVKLVIAADPVRSAGRLSRFSAHSKAALQPQEGSDLGQRMYRALARARLEGSQRTVLIGCDCPQLQLQDLKDAFDRLNEADIVMTPTLDGGYCLIGVTGNFPELFDDMPWGTEQIHELTLQRAQHSGYLVRNLSKRADIDRLADWQRWQRERNELCLSEHAWHKN